MKSRKRFIWNIITSRYKIVQEQCDIDKDPETWDAIFMITMISEISKAEGFALIFIDYRKTIDMVRHKHLFELQGKLYSELQRERVTNYNTLKDNAKNV